ncbi:MAG: hypothetical protein ACJA2C_001444 [Marinoscillum sp.]|jgi:hypothetical protein
MQRSVLSLLSFFFCLGISFAQDQFSDRFRFIRHLESIEAYTEGMLYLDQIERQDFSIQRIDSLNYMHGRFSYLLKNRKVAIQYFDKVTTASIPQFNASRFYAGLESAYLGEFAQSKTYFEAIVLQTDLERELQRFQFKALALLQRDFVQYELYQKEESDANFHLKDHGVILDESYRDLIDHKKKSPVIAGLMSAVIPGSGKMYNGQFGQGIMTLVTASIFGLQAYEGYRKDGINSTPFIAFGSLFTLFHISNIYGSVVAVRLGETNFNNNQDESILLRMHIPIRVLHK